MKATRITGVVALLVGQRPALDHTETGNRERLGLWGRLLSLDHCVLALIDHQPQMLFGVCLGKESTMTLERVLYTATAHTTAGRDGGGRRARHSVLTTWAAAGAFGLALLAAPCDAQAATQRETTVAQTEITTGAIRPFRVNIPEAALVDLRQRVLATRWPEKETVNDQSQGVRLEQIQALVHYWGTSYDWRKIEAQPQPFGSRDLGATYR